MTMERLKTAALFDLDGVLVDTETVYTEFWSEMDRLFPTGTPDFANVIKGSTLPSILANYFPSEDDRAKVVELLKEQEENMRYAVFDGVIDFLEDLKRHDIPAAIVTSSGDKKMKRLFATNPGFREYFGTVITDSDVKRSKPDPEGYLLGALRLGCNPECAYVFEDSYAGVEAGRRAGANVIALATTNPRAALKEKADAVIDTFVGFSVADMLAVSRL